MLAGAENGGAETFFVNLCTALTAQGIDTRAVIRRNPTRARLLESGSVPVRETRYGRWFDFRTKRVLANEVRSFRPDVVLAFMNRAAAVIPAGPHLKVGRLGGFYDLKYYRRCDHLVCNTEGIHRHVVDAGWPADRCSVIYNFAEVDDSPPADRAALGVPEGATVLFTPARLHRAKGLDTLIQAAADLPDVHLWIAGSGPEEGTLRRQAAELAMADRVRFLGWRTDTGAFFRACDAVAFPSRHEPFGTAAIEAWAYGKPLVVSDADGPAEYVSNDVDALMVPRDDVAALRSALVRVKDDPALAERLVAAATRRHTEQFTREACVKAYVDLFDRLRLRRAA